MIKKTFNLSATETLEVTLHDNGEAFGNYRNSQNGNFDCMNNRDLFGQGDSFEKTFPMTEAGLNIAANYFMVQMHRVERVRRQVIAKRRQERQQRIAKRQEGLKGGLRRRPIVAGLSL